MSRAAPQTRGTGSSRCSTSWPTGSPNPISADACSSTPSANWGARPPMSGALPGSTRRRCATTSPISSQRRSCRPSSPINWPSWPTARSSRRPSGVTARTRPARHGAPRRRSSPLPDRLRLERSFSTLRPSGERSFYVRATCLLVDTKGSRMTDTRPPFPPFTLETAIQKVQAAEDAWNSRDPHLVSLAYTPDSEWRNREQHIVGRTQIVDFLTAKWQRELDYVLRKSLWGFRENRIAVRFQYESHDASGQWYRSYGNELWEFTPEGLMSRREASINDVPITESERRFFGPRPKSEHGQDIPLW